MRVELRGVTKKFGEVAALDDVTLSLEPGQRCALIGPNGAGKSTLTRCVMGMMTCEGEIRLDGLSPFTDRVQLARNLAYVPQIAPRLASSVGELLRAIASLRDLDVAQIEGVAKHLNLPLDEIRRQPFRNLSGGMRQKLLLALALCEQASLLILDEPSASLDAETRVRFFQLIEELPGNPTIILSSHRLEEIRNLVDDVALLQNGNLAFFGSASEFLEQRSTSTIEVHVETERARRHLADQGFHRRRSNGWWVASVDNQDRGAIVRRLTDELGEELLDIVVRDVESLDLREGELAEVNP